MVALPKAVRKRVLDSVWKPKMVMHAFEFYLRKKSPNWRCAEFSFFEGIKNSHGKKEAGVRGSSDGSGLRCWCGMWATGWSRELSVLLVRSPRLFSSCFGFIQIVHSKPRQEAGAAHLSHRKTGTGCVCALPRSPPVS